MLWILLILGVAVAGALSPTSYLTANDRVRLQKVLQPGWDLKDVAQVYYSASGYKILGWRIPDGKGACTFVKQQASDTASVETLFMAAGAAKSLGCPLTPSAAVKQTLSAAIRDGASSQELYYAVFASVNLGIKVESAKVVKASQNALKKDDSVLSLGYAFHVGSAVTGDVAVLFERVEDALVQADEVDEKMLQFEGGLSITALVLSGAYRLCETAKRTPPIKPDQAVKFANYLLSRKSVQLAKGVHYLLQALATLTDNKYHIPVAITLASPVAVSTSSPKVQVRVTDVMGSPLPPQVTVTCDSATHTQDNDDIANNEKLSPVAGNPGVYQLDVMGRKPKRGFYSLEVSANSGDSRLVGHDHAELLFKVLTAVSVDNFEIGTGDADQSTPPNLSKLSYPAKLTKALEADQHQRVILRFIVRDSVSDSSTIVHQAFVRVTHKSSKREIIFVAEADSSDVYKFDMDVTARTKDFGGVSGDYSIELIIGDASISNPMRWMVGDVKLSFPEGTVTPTPAQSSAAAYKPLEEIKHVFRQADPRPSNTVSTAFTALCAAPIILLLALWAKLGVNVSNFPISLTAVGFHLGIGAILGLFFIFWVKLTMFETLRYLLMLGAVTFFCGNSMLSSIAAKRKEKKLN